MALGSVKHRQGSPGGFPGAGCADGKVPVRSLDGAWVASEVVGGNERAERMGVGRGRGLGREESRERRRAAWREGLWDGGGVLVPAKGRARVRWPAAPVGALSAGAWASLALPRACAESPRRVAQRARDRKSVV